MARPFLFNPGRAIAEEWEQTFIVREPILAQLCEDLQRDSHGGTMRHWLVVVSSGRGKSHMLSLVGHRMRKQGWRVVQLPEEQDQVSSLGDLLEQIIVRLQSGKSPLEHIVDPQRL